MFYSFVKKHIPNFQPLCQYVTISLSLFISPEACPRLFGLRGAFSRDWRPPHQFIPGILLSESFAPHIRLCWWNAHIRTSKFESGKSTNWKLWRVHFSVAYHFRTLKSSSRKQTTGSSFSLSACRSIPKSYLWKWPMQFLAPWRDCPSES